MKNRITSIMYIAFLFLLFLYSAIQCFIPAIYFDLNNDNLNIKLSKICTDFFDMKFNISVTSYESNNESEVIINFINNAEKNSFGEATLSKTIFNRYRLIKVDYTDTKKLTHSYENTVGKSDFTLFASLIISLFLLFILILSKYRKKNLQGG